MIGKFKYNNFWYIITYDGKYKIGKLDNGTIIYNFNLEEKRVISKILDNITPDKNIMEVIPIKISDNKYQVYFDYSKDIFMFNPLPNENDLIKLNKIFNDRNTYAYLGSNNNKDDYIRRVIRLGKDVIIIFLSATIVFNSSLRSDILNQIDYTVNSVIEDISIGSSHLKHPYNFNDIVTAIETNSNLSGEEKQLILSHPEIFEDNYKYMNYDNLLEKLSTLSLVYHSEANPGINGTYDTATNTIDFYKVTSFSEVKENTFTHELSHALQENIIENSFLKESTNVIVNNEYYGNCYPYDVSYSFYVDVTRALGEIVGTEVIKEYYNKCSNDVIINALMKIVPNKKSAEYFISLLQEYHSIYIKYCKNKDNNLKQSLSNIEKKIILEIKYYYEIKYNKSMYDDLVMLGFLDKENFVKKCSEVYEIPIEAAKYLKFCDGKGCINSSLIDRNYYTFSFPVMTKRYTYITWDDAYKDGIVEKRNDEIIIKDGYMLDKDNDLFMVSLVPSSSGVLQYFTIDDNNRYINSTLVK